MKFLKALLLGTVLAAAALPAVATTVFYWRVESLTLSATDDKSSDNSGTNVSAGAIDTTGKHNGTNGYRSTSSADYNDFDPTGMCSAMVTSQKGTLAGWIQFKTAVPGTGARQVITCHNTTTSSLASFTVGNSQEARLELSNAAGTTLNLVSNSCNFAIDTWYFVQVTWDVVADDRKVSCYSDTSPPTLIDSVSDLSTDVGASEPASFDSQRVGSMTTNTNAIWVDNVFAADTYNFDFSPYANITSYVPTYTAGPTIGTPTASTIPNTYTTDQPGTTYAAACTNGQTIATFANLKTGTCSGGAAVGTGTDTNTAAVGDTVTITGLSAGVTYDVYIGQESGIGGQSAISSKADQQTAATPSFDTACSITSQTTSVYTCTYDTANAGNFFIAAYKDGSSAPTCDQIEAGTGTGFVVNNTEAATNSSDTLTLSIPGGDPFPFYDLYACAESADGSTDTSVTTLGNEILDTPTGRQYVIKSGAPGGGESGILDGASPAAVDGDWIDASTTTDSFGLGAAAHTLTVNADTTYVIDAGGDLTRQILTRRFYDVSLAAWSDSAPVELAINDLAPYFISGFELFNFIDDVAIEAVILDGIWIDPEDDDVTHAIANGPTGISVSGSETLVGTVTTCGTDSDTQLTATDEYGEATAQIVTMRTGALVPNVLGQDEAAASAAIEALCSITATAGTPEYSASVALGLVISTTPAADEFLVYNADVVYILSLGELSSAVPGNGGNSFDAAGRLFTHYLDTVTAVPGTATFHGGIAYATDGARYVCSFPGNGIVGWVNGAAIRPDGCQTITTQAPVFFTNGVPLTALGELSATTSNPVDFSGGYGFVSSKLAVTDLN